jgi:hypothetical protein
MRHLEGTWFKLPGGHEIFVTHKYNILSGPEEWLAPVVLASVAHAMRVADDDSTNRLYVSTDSPDRFDDRYPNHIRDVFLERAADDKRITVAFLIDR